VVFNSAEMSVAPILIKKRVEILAKMMQNGEKKQMLGTGATFGPELNLSQCYI